MTDIPPPATPDERWARRERPTLVAIGVLGVAVLALATTWAVRAHDPDDRPRASAGNVYPDVQGVDDLSGDTEVVVPWARLRVAVGEVAPELPASFDEGLASVRPPEDGSFVQVAVEAVDDYQVPMAAVDVPFTSVAEVVLSADGRDYPLTGPHGLDLAAGDDSLGRPVGGTLWVAVEGQPTDLSIAVTVDGHRD